MQHLFAWSSLDESSDRKQRDAFVVAGLVMAQPAWTELERAWDRMVTDRGIGHFKTSEFRGLRGGFAKFHDGTKYPKPTGRAAAQEIFDDLALLIRSNKHWSLGLAVGLNLSDYRALRKSSRVRRLFPRNPYRFVYHTIMVMLAMMVGEFKESEPIAFLCDEHSLAKDLSNTYAALKESNPHAARFMGSLTFTKDELSPALQVADLIVGEYKDYFVRRVKGKATAHSEYSEFMEAMKGPMGIFYLDKRVLSDMARANMLIDGKPSIRSLRHAKLFPDLLKRRTTPI